MSLCKPGFGKALGGNHHARGSCLTGHRGEQYPACSGAQAPCKIKFGDGEEGAIQCGDLAGRQQERACKCEVNGESTFWKQCRDQIEEHLALGELQALLRECSGQAIPSLARGEIGQADNLHAREAAADEALDTKSLRSAIVQAGAEDCIPHIQVTGGGRNGDEIKGQFLLLSRVR